MIQWLLPVFPRGLAALALFALVSLSSPLGLGGTARAEGPVAPVLPADVKAFYKVRFTALGEIGTFNFNSQVSGKNYTLTANAKIDTAIFDYRGNMTSVGVVTPAGIVKTQPSSHTFEYRQKALLKKKKLKGLNIAFDRGAVKAVTPPDPLGPKYVPVTAEQLNNVLDPLSGVMALSMVDAAKPCDQKLPIYDGKARFDIQFKLLRRSGADHICSVKLVPVSGHKPGEGAASVVNGEIELVMRPVPNANVVIPFRVTVPTVVGTATLVSERVDITMPDQKRIALRR
ncbi:DUF3108 domain-containing protein [Hyphomicrobium sp. D-2]|uniref:DUF3108 domain-containing protein n=1 Tax=Hyphomicrobium sp. D-2 TaxID=3041621 RepID=UPI002457F91D|nr:DUF3108 domain-containing protein [Hyphomicrobium sp. D-2]MDH4983545.1 DUF3108 domain-containing protein [Hyphomicrobium sp. D-2]